MRAQHGLDSNGIGKNNLGCPITSVLLSFCLSQSHMWWLFRGWRRDEMGLGSPKNKEC